MALGAVTGQLGEGEKSQQELTMGEGEITKGTSALYQGATPT